jgi:uncharacterized protein YbaR (Trm112 family)
MTGGAARESFGCERCWPASANAAQDARRTLVREAELIDESHFHVMILACPSCRQRYLSVFTEMIDWDDGDDPQYWTTLPLTDAEAADLVRRRDSLDEATLNALGPGRRSLLHDHPKGVDARTHWGSGIFVGPHD